MEFVSGPTTDAGDYLDSRSGFDSAIGFFDGLASTVGSIGNVVDQGADATESYARGATALDELRAARDERETADFLERFKVERGDNLQLYYAGAAVAVALIFLMR